ncbi:MAG: hypothetical protein C5B51_28225 [Terriglobia bacterium]|nr:MAG: hypothetical protein C5B51_28225 [Terriglobia bacterium]
MQPGAPWGIRSKTRSANQDCLEGTAVIRVFLSYASEDRARVEILYQNLLAAGFQPWMDTHDLMPGEVWSDAIQRGVQSADCFLACLSPRSIVKDGVLGNEIRTALGQWERKGRGSKYRLIPVRLELVQIPQNLALLQWFDLFRDEQWTELAKVIRQVCEPKPAPPAKWLRVVELSSLVAALALGIWWYTSPSKSMRWPSGPVRLGVTVWKLREATAADKPGAKILVQPHANQSAPLEFIPERADLAKPFVIGDRVRATFESAQEGYLYVIDQERRTGGALGHPKLIFPTMRIRGGHNEVHSGQLVETPPQEEEDPYWEFKKGETGYAGELLTVIFSRQPIPELGAAKEARYVDENWFHARLKEWTLPLGRTEAGSKGTATAAEVAAGKNGARILTADDPRPETTFSGTPKRGAPLVASFALNVS